MKSKTYRQLRVLVSFFVVMIVAVAVFRESYLLLTVGVITGISFMMLVRSKIGIKTDERELTVQEKAARLTYSIFAPTIGLTALLLLIPTKSGFSVFRNGEWLFVETTGMLLAYISLFLIIIYALSYHFFNRKFGGKTDEK